MSSHTNHHECASCEQAHKGINGRYCRVLKKYVEYAAEPLCNTKNKNYSSIKPSNYA